MVTKYSSLNCYLKQYKYVLSFYQKQQLVQTVKRFLKALPWHISAYLGLLLQSRIVCWRQFAIAPNWLLKDAYVYQVVDIALSRLFSSIYVYRELQIGFCKEVYLYRQARIGFWKPYISQEFATGKNWLLKDVYFLVVCYSFESAFGSRMFLGSLLQVRIGFWKKCMFIRSS